MPLQKANVNVILFEVSKKVQGRYDACARRGATTKYFENMPMTRGIVILNPTLKPIAQRVGQTAKDIEAGNIDGKIPIERGIKPTIFPIPSRKKQRIEVAEILQRSCLDCFVCDCEVMVL